MTRLVRIIGIDPGLRRMGWGVIESDGVRLTYVASGVVTSNAKAALAHRLLELFEGLVMVLDNWEPKEASVEETFVNRDARATLKLGHARGVGLLASALSGLVIAEYAPNQIKKTVVGSGHADKQQIQAMVRHLLPRAKPETDDEADALAVAITHAHMRDSLRRADAIATGAGAS